MAKQSQKNYALEHDPILVSSNWSNIWSKTSSKFTKSPSSTTSSTPISSSTFSPAPPTQPLDQQSQILRAKQLKPPIEANIDWQTAKAPKFIALNINFDCSLPQVYEEASGTQIWEICVDQTERCIQFIRDECSDKQVFLVCSGSLGRIVVPSIHNLNQVYAIYMHCLDVLGHQQWTQDLSKVRVVCSDDKDDLIPQLAFDSAYFNYQWACALITKGDKVKAKDRLTKALQSLKKHTKSRYDKQFEVDIEKKLKECQ